MAKNKTRDEIIFEVLKLQKQKNEVPQKDFFGDDNWRAIDIKIAVLKGEKSLSDFDDDINGSDQDLLDYDAAQDADLWLNGDFWQDSLVDD